MIECAKDLIAVDGVRHVSIQSNGIRLRVRDCEETYDRIVRVCRTHNTRIRSVSYDEGWILWIF
jgi:hypothetical protein